MHRRSGRAPFPTRWSAAPRAYPTASTTALHQEISDDRIPRLIRLDRAPRPATVTPVVAGAVHLRRMRRDGRWDRRTPGRAGPTDRPTQRPRLRPHREPSIRRAMQILRVLRTCNRTGRHHPSLVRLHGSGTRSGTTPVSAPRSMARARPTPALHWTATAERRHIRSRPRRWTPTRAPGTSGLRTTAIRRARRATETRASNLPPQHLPVPSALRWAAGTWAAIRVRRHRTPWVAAVFRIPRPQGLRVRTVPRAARKAKHRRLIRAVTFDHRTRWPAARLRERRRRHRSNRLLQNLFQGRFAIRCVPNRTPQHDPVTAPATARRLSSMNRAPRPPRRHRSDLAPNPIRTPAPGTPPTPVAAHTISRRIALGQRGIRPTTAFSDRMS